MIKEAINRILELSTPTVTDIHGYQYSDRALHRVDPPSLRPLAVHTLTAVVDYIHSVPDNSRIPSDFLVHIKDYDSVTLYGALLQNMNRESILEVTLNDVSPKFGQWYDLESFNIMMQSCFIPNDDSANILRLVGNVVDNNLKTTGDDGVTQQVTVKTGISLVGNEVVPNPVSLIPYRTFIEAKQPESKYVFRLRKQGETISAALFEADGGKWKNAAIQAIMDFFTENIKLSDDSLFVNFLA
jgi:hypothetical protein